MPNPRVFISSTFSDLLDVRNHVGRVVSNVGCEVVLAERGNIAYLPDKDLPTSCYEAVDDCDLLISVIGTRYGSTDARKQMSVSEAERARAKERRIHVITFVHRDVSRLFEFFLENSHKKDVVYPGIADLDVLEFLRRVKYEFSGLPIFDYDNLEGIEQVLRTQLASMIGTALRQPRQQFDLNLAEKLDAHITELRGLISDTWGAIDLRSREYRALSYHPVITQFEDAVPTRYRCVFRNRQELISYAIDVGFSLMDDPAHLILSRPLPRGYRGEFLATEQGRHRIENYIDFIGRHGVKALEVASLRQVITIPHHVFGGEARLKDLHELERDGKFVICKYRLEPVASP